jgi:hypothetical protein
VPVKQIRSNDVPGAEFVAGGKSEQNDYLPQKNREWQDQQVPAAIKWTIPGQTSLARGELWNDELCLIQLMTMKMNDSMKNILIQECQYSLELRLIEVMNVTMLLIQLTSNVNLIECDG